MLKNRGRKPPRKRKEERELFFWTAQEAIKLGISLALAIYLILGLASGSIPILRLLNGI